MMDKQMDKQFDGFPEKLRAERRKLKLSQDKMAECLGVHKQTYSRYERGINLPSGKKLDALLALGIDPSFLFSGGRKIGTEKDEAGGRSKEETLVKGTGPEYGEHFEEIKIGLLTERDEGERMVAERQIVKVITRAFKPWVIGQFGHLDTLMTFIMNSDNMEPVLHRGDLLFIDGQYREVNGSGIYVFNNGRSIQVRRVYERLDSTIYCCSDNPVYKEGNFEMARENFISNYGQGKPVQVEGKVMKVLTSI